MGATVLRETIYKVNVDWKVFLKSVPLPYISYKILGGGRTLAESTKDFLDKIEETTSDKTLERVDFFDAINWEHEGFKKPEARTIVKVIRDYLKLLQQYNLFQLRVKK